MHFAQLCAKCGVQPDTGDVQNQQRSSRWFGGWFWNHFSALLYGGVVAARQVVPPDVLAILSNSDAGQ